jgi:hypothetical protein
MPQQKGREGEEEEEEQTKREREGNRALML